MPPDRKFKWGYDSDSEGQYNKNVLLFNMVLDSYDKSLFTGQG